MERVKAKEQFNKLYLCSQIWANLGKIIIHAWVLQDIPTEKVEGIYGDLLEIYFLCYLKI